jgi:photosystem II stability/assembly factor-like uncharacterized protein
MRILPFKILLILLFTCSVSAQDYWLHVPSPTNRLLSKSCFIDSVYGWAAGDSGTIVYTTNGGLNWGLQNSGITNYNIDDIYFLNKRLGWAVSNDYFFHGSFMLKTTNGGANWSWSYFPDSNVVINSIYYIDSLRGIATGFSGQIFYTTNNGANWSQSYIDSTGCPYLYRFPKNRIRFNNSQTGYCAGGQMDLQGIVWRTTNSGLNWQTFCLTPEPLFDIKVINSNKIITSGGDFEFGAITSTTYNNSASWIYRNIELYGVAREIAFRTDKEVWMPLSFAQSWAVSLDTGSYTKPWVSIPAPDSTAVYSAVFKSPTFGFAFGSYGAILKYNTSVIGITPGTVIAKNFSLGQNYPNPFNPVTKINYYLPKGEYVKITIYDLLGKVVKVYPEGFRPEGNNNFTFTSIGLASGVYIYKLQAGDFSESKKMVIVK